MVPSATQKSKEGLGKHQTVARSLNGTLLQLFSSSVPAMRQSLGVRGKLAHFACQPEGESMDYCLGGFEQMVGSHCGELIFFLTGFFVKVSKSFLHGLMIEFFRGQKFCCEV